MKTVYYISAPTSDEFIRMVNILFSLKFVFSSRREKTMEEIKRDWPNWVNWKYIQLNGDYECKNVIHAGECFDACDAFTFEDVLRLIKNGKL